MAGGRFTPGVSKVRPGRYYYFKSARQEVLGASDRGTVIIPLGTTDYGPSGEMMYITGENPDANLTKLGYSVYDNDPNGNMLMIREALKGASKVIVYICPAGTAKATGTGGGLTGTAKYKGTRGNKLKYVIVANPVSGFDVTVFLDNAIVEEFNNVATYADLAGSEWIDFAKSSDEAVIAATSGVTLTGGTDSTVTSSEVTAFLTASEGEAWNVMAFPFTDSSLQAAVKTKVTYLINEVGKNVQAAVPAFTGADYEGIINVSNSYGLDGADLTTAQATAYVAGITAGATAADSNTGKIVSGAIKVVNPKSHEASVTAINNGEFFFSMSEAGNVVVEYDINSLVTFTGKDTGYRKNKIIRIFYLLQELIDANFPVGKFSNDEIGWASAEGIGKSILLRLGPSDNGSGVITNIDFDNDFLVDREMSTGDQMYFKVGIQPVDAAEKLYFTITTR